MSELKILFPQPEVIELSGKRIKIYPVKLRDFELYGKEAGALINILDSMGSERLLKYAHEHAHGIRKVLSRTTGLSAWQIRRLPAPAAVQLLLEVVRVNSSFFGEALPEMVRALSGALLSSD